MLCLEFDLWTQLQKWAQRLVPLTQEGLSFYRAGLILFICLVVWFVCWWRQGLVFRPLHLHNCSSISGIQFLEPPDSLAHCCSSFVLTSLFPERQTQTSEASPHWAGWTVFPNQLFCKGYLVFLILPSMQEQSFEISLKVQNFLRVKARCWSGGALGKKQVSLHWELMNFQNLKYSLTSHSLHSMKRVLKDLRELLFFFQVGLCLSPYKSPIIYNLWFSSLDTLHSIHA